MTNIIKGIKGQAKVIAGVVALVALLTSCGGPATPTPSASTPTPTAVAVADTQQAIKAAPAPAPAPAPAEAPKLRVMTSPQTLTKEGSVFFLVSSQDFSGQGLSKTEVFVDGVQFVNDPKQYNSYAKYFSAKQNGTHTVRVVVTDKAGQSSTVEQEFVVNIAN